MTHPLPINLGFASTTPPMAAQVTSPENHKYKSKIHPDYVKIINMISKKSHSSKLFLWKNIFIVTASFLASFLGLNFNSNEASALFVPTLSASINQANLQVNGNQVINSATQTTELPLNFTVNTNNRTGYTATISTETNNTSLSIALRRLALKLAQLVPMQSLAICQVILGATGSARPRITHQFQLSLVQHKSCRLQEKQTATNRIN